MVNVTEMAYEDLNELIGAYVYLSNQMSAVVEKMESVKALEVVADLHEDILRQSEPFLRELMARRENGERLVSTSG